MPITWIPKRGSGYWHNGYIVGDGTYLNYNISLFEQGNFTNKVLEDANGIVINYSNSTNVSVRVGTYHNGVENGQILEYVFPKGSWNSFYSGTVISTTRYTHHFSNGNWQSTSNTSSNISLKITFDSNPYHWKFAVTEI